LNPLGADCEINGFNDLNDTHEHAVMILDAEIFRSLLSLPCYLELRRLNWEFTDTDYGYVLVYPIIMKPCGGKFIVPAMDKV